ncbi:MAG: TonB-dependent receptor [Candidatus Latescibacteria bacterium]|nr:TonB-dependent receptor [Candidatus Latescibacterota bacterium]
MRRVPFFPLLPLLCLLGGLLVPSLSVAETTGKLAGVIVDQATHDPLPGVSVVVVGTRLGTVSDLKGKFFILNVPVGQYTVEARMIGYTTIRKSAVVVNTDLTTRTDFDLQTTVLDVNEVVTITASRPLIRPDLTASSEVLSSNELLRLPVKDLSGVLLLQNGVVQDGQGGIHVRGGRSDELTYYLDGKELNDPLLGGIGTQINLDAIEEMVINRGGFDAQYGDAMSGIVNIITKEGRAGSTGRLRSTVSLQPQYDVQRGAYRRPAFANGRSVEGTMGGALPRLGESGTFFVSGQRKVGGNDLPHHQSTINTMTGNMVFRVHPLLKVKVSGHVATRRQGIYDHRDQNGVSYDFNLDGLPERRDRSDELSLAVNHTLSPRTFYTARFYRYTAQSKLAPAALFDTHWTAWPGYSVDDQGRYNGTIHDTNYKGGWAYAGLPFTGGADFLPIYRRARTTYYGLRVDLSSQVTLRNQVRLGLEGQWYRLAWDEKSFVQPSPSGERYHANPVEGALYMQDKIEFSRLIVNAGVRIDYFDTGERFFVNLPTGQAELINSPTKMRLSPRVGLSYPMTAGSLLRFSYGYFFQPPEFRFAYENLRADLSTASPRVGNPNLNPQKTVAYELGFEQLVTDHLRVSLTGTYKSLSNLTSTTQVRYPGGTYSIFTNADFGTVRGLEFSLTRRATRNISGTIQYAYSVATGSASDPQEQYNTYTKTGKPSSLREFALAFDQRHTLTAVLSAQTPTTWRKGWLSFPLNGWGVNLISRYGSGMPYTPTTATGERIHSEPNTERLPATLNFDLRLDKRFQVGTQSCAFFTEVENLFDRRNVINVYANTGSPEDDGYRQERLSGASPEFAQLRRLLSLNPQHFSPPREVRLGVEVTF